MKMRAFFSHIALYPCAVWAPHPNPLPKGEGKRYISPLTLWENRTGPAGRASAAPPDIKPRTKNKARLPGP
ncbi:hypothetical protein DBY73_000575 [Enterobacter sp. RIT418]|nr:hypothetical protein DBY73_000575 [Enterobacter sp. RIT 418]